MKIKGIGFIFPSKLRFENKTAVKIYKLARPPYDDFHVGGSPHTTYY
jgi:hypothetical protein